MTNIIVQVGHYLGEYWTPVDEPADEPDHYEIQVGDKVMELERDEAQVWSAAALDPAKQRDLQFTREVLQDVLVEADKVADPAPIMDELVKNGLLIEYDPVDRALEDLFRRYTLHPLGVGFGNTPDKPLAYRIGPPSEPMVNLTSTMQSMGTFSFRSRSLWHFCESYAEPSIERFSLDELARETARTIPMLVSLGLGFLDPVVGEAPA